MHPFNIIFRPLRRGLLLALCVLCALGARGQADFNQKLQNRPYIDFRPFHYGFMIGLHNQNLNLQNNGFIDPETGAQWLAENDRMDPSLSVGVLGEWRMHPHVALRVQPTMHFGNKHVTFRNQTDGALDYQDIKSTYISVPVDVKLTGLRCGNRRPYVVTGLNFTYDLTTKSDDNLKMKAFTPMFEIGFGCDYYLPFFKFIPELKFCFGLNNILDTNRADLKDKSKQVFTQSVSRATVSMVMLTFYFE